MNVFGIWIFKGLFCFFWLNVRGDVRIIEFLLSFVCDVFSYGLYCVNLFCELCR